jgi:type II secretory pathway pseudopilin PulG
MIVIAILGVLAAVAIAAYGAYIRRSRNAEATSLLADIRLKQEAYRGVFHQYASGIPDACESKWVPRTTPDNEAASGYISGDDCRAAWRQLGITFPSSVYFVYDTQAGAPNVGATGRYAAANSGSDFWYGAAAIQDLDKNGECAGFVVVSGDMGITEIEEAASVCQYE